MNHSRICSLDAHAQAELVRRGEVSPGELIDAAMAQIEAVNPAVNAVSYKAHEEALRAATSVDRNAPMAGVPCLLKASLEYTGFPMLSGSRIREGSVGTRKYPFVARMDEAGLIPCGMSTMPEFGLIGTGEAILYGPTRNPWNPGCSSGGSSSGAAVAVATGMVPLATGSDGGGSIRIPASHCGIIGFKPSRSWNLRARAPALIDDFLTSDALYGRSMRDTIWAAHSMRLQPPGKIGLDRPLRIALSLKGIDGGLPDTDVSDMLQAAAKMCEALGHRVELQEPSLDFAALEQAFDILWSYGAGDVVDFYRGKRGADADTLLEPWTLGLAERRIGVTPDALAQAFHAISLANQALEQFWEKFDVVLSPVTTSKAPPLGVLAPTREFEALWRDHFRHVNYTQLQNMTGLPGISVPLLSTPSGMPAGAMFWTKHGGDDLLLSLGAALEAAYPWADRWPPVANLASS